MKKAIALILAGMLLFGAACAEFSLELLPNAPAVTLDLNGDGETESVRVQTFGDDEDAETMLVIIGGDGGVNTLTVPIAFELSSGTADLDGDGHTEIYLSGSQTSFDYVAWCVLYTDEGLKTVSFPSFDRGGILEGESESGYGRITEIGNGRVTLAGMQDVLGTYFAARTLCLKDGRFEFADDGLFVFENDPDDPDVWEWRSLSPLRAIPVTFSNGETGELRIGETFILTASDSERVVFFRTRDGKTGSFAIEPDAQRGWGSLIEGVSEKEFFEYLPYAD